MPILWRNPIHPGHSIHNIASKLPSLGLHRDQIQSQSPRAMFLPTNVATVISTFQSVDLGKQSKQEFPFRRLPICTT
jgi:hypothetical protein